LKVHYDINVKGRVQGVFYRASARAKATQLELNGFVRNNADGSVYAEVEGENENVQLFIAWCRKGPSAARVERVESTEGELKYFNGFEIVK
jgi:acylphosphatase